MRLRIAIWSFVGALVVVLWTLYFPQTSSTPFGLGWILMCLTCPIAMARHHAFSFYFVVLLNAGTYALVGSVVEAIRNHRPRLSSN